jgi:hypothetical protein
VWDDCTSHSTSSTHHLWINKQWKIVGRLYFELILPILRFAFWHSASKSENKKKPATFYKKENPCNHAAYATPSIHTLLCSTCDIIRTRCSCSSSFQLKIAHISCSTFVVNKIGARDLTRDFLKEFPWLMVPWIASSLCNYTTGDMVVGSIIEAPIWDHTHSSNYHEHWLVTTLNSKARHAVEEANYSIKGIRASPCTYED